MASLRIPESTVALLVPRHPTLRITDSLILRGLLGALLAGAVAAAAERAGSLTPRGRWAAFAVGTLSALAGWGWAALLIAYFVTSSALTRMGAAAKSARTASVLPDAQARDAAQVGANGGLFAVLALGGTLGEAPILHVAAVGALAAATADTWATELGILLGGTPRHLLTLAPLEAGMSGGVTLVGTAASLLAAVLVACAGVALTDRPASWSAAVGAFTAAGVAGSVADSLLGATMQSKRWCERCRTWTERRVHTCQYRTQHLRGSRWMTNDTVNLLATLIGAATAVGLSWRSA